jgi:hypothetical protein
MVHRVKLDFLLRKMVPQKLESDLINRSPGALILVATVSLTMVYSVLLILYALMVQDGKIEPNIHLMLCLSLPLKKVNMSL